MLFSLLTSMNKRVDFFFLKLFHFNLSTSICKKYYDLRYVWFQEKIRFNFLIFCYVVINIRLFLEFGK